MPKQLRSWGEAKFYAESALIYAAIHLQGPGLLSRVLETLRAYFGTCTFISDMVLPDGAHEIKNRGRHFVAGAC